MAVPGTDLEHGRSQSCPGHSLLMAHTLGEVSQHFKETIVIFLGRDLRLCQLGKPPLPAAREAHRCLSCLYCHPSQSRVLLARVGWKLTVPCACSLREAERVAPSDRSDEWQLALELRPVPRCTALPWAQRLPGTLNPVCSLPFL